MTTLESINALVELLKLAPNMALMPAGTPVREKYALLVISLFDRIKV